MALLFRSLISRLKMKSPKKKRDEFGLAFSVCFLDRLMQLSGKMREVLFSAQ